MCAACSEGRQIVIGWHGACERAVTHGVWSSFSSQIAIQGRVNRLAANEGEVSRVGVGQRGSGFANMAMSSQFGGDVLAGLLGGGLLGHGGSARPRPDYLCGIYMRSRSSRGELDTRDYFGETLLLGGVGRSVAWRPVREMLSAIAATCLGRWGKGGERRRGASHSVLRPRERGREPRFPRQPN